MEPDQSRGEQSNMAGPKRWLRWVQHPTITLAALIILCFDLTTLPRGTTVGGGLYYLTHARSTWSTQTYDVYFIREADGWRLVDPEFESYDEIAEVMETRPHEIVLAMAPYRDVMRGYWDYTRHEKGWNKQLSLLNGEPLEHEDSEAISSAYDDYMLRVNQIDISDGVKTTVLWKGYVHSAAALAVLVVLIVSLGWVPRAPAWIRSVRARRALRTRHCLNCRYDLGDLDACPECGVTCAETERIAATHS